MKKARKKAIFLSLIVALVAGGFLSSLFAQNTKKDLELKRQKLLEDIAHTEKILHEAHAQTRESLSYLSALRNQVNNRRKLVRALTKEISEIEEQIEFRTARVDTLQSDIKNLKAFVGQLLYEGYKMRDRNTRLSFIFGAGNFNQMLKRRRYLRNMVEYRQEQLDLVKEARNEERMLIQGLIDNRNEKLMLLRKREDEENIMTLDQLEMEKLVRALKGKEEEIKQDLAAKQKAARELEIAIRKAIEEEIRKAKEEEERRRREMEEQRKKKKEMTVLPGADIQLSREFSSNYGKLPWPVNNGYISEQFGTHPHPQLSNIQTENNGINIISTKGALASAVFSGVVSAIVEVPGMQTTVLVKHGEYFTVYSKLSEVYVSKGDAVTIGQALGKLATSPEGITEMHFEVWKGSTKQNPEGWLAKGI